jgi:hypothetical protein
MAESSIKQYFKAFASFGASFASFPHLSSILTRHHKSSIASFLLKLYTYIIYIVSLAIIIQLIPYSLSTNYWVTNAKKNTDRFCFLVFLVCFFLLKLICHSINLWKSYQIVSLINSFESYEKSQVSQGKKKGKKITPFNSFEGWFLLFGSIITIVGKYHVAYSKEVEMFSQQELIFILTGGNLTAATVIIYAIHFITELSFVFYMTSLIFFSRCLNCKMVELQDSIRQQFLIGSVRHKNGLQENFMELDTQTNLPMFVQDRVSLSACHPI